MSKKDFMRGVEAAVNAQKGFNEKQAKATEEIAKRVVKKIDDLGNVVDIMIDQLNAQEKERLYSLKEQFDPKDLDESERELLVSVLYTLSMQYEQNTPQQMTYYYNLKKYLEVVNPSCDCDISCVENIENVNDSKGIYAIVCEFLFLQHGDHSYQDEFSDFLDSFYVKPKDIRSVEEQINTRYEIMGADDIIKHFDFGYNTFSEINNACESEFENDVMENSGITYKDLKNITDNSYKLQSLNLPDYRFERNYKAPLEITGKKIHLNSLSTINTSITLKQCIISYQKGNGAKLVVGSNASLTFIDCCFECTQKRNKKIMDFTTDPKLDVFKEEDDEHFITTNENVNKIEFIRCSFKSCCEFMNDLQIDTLNIEDCYLVYPEEFLTVKDECNANCSICNNVIITNPLKEDLNVFEFKFKNSVVMHNNLFVGVKTPDYISTEKTHWFSSYGLWSHPNYIVSAKENLDMQNCTFYNINHCITTCNLVTDCTVLNCNFVRCSNVATYIQNINGCDFVDCSNVIESSVCSMNLNDCVFYNCKKSTIKADNETSINNCSFLSCTDHVLDIGSRCVVGNCDFKHIKTNNQTLISMNSNGKIEYCTFDDIELGEKYITECFPASKKSSRDQLVKDCVFSNIHTKRQDKEIVRESYEVGSVFTSTVYNADIRNCSGINNTDRGKLLDIIPEYNKTKGNGKTAGALFPENFCDNFAENYIKQNVINGTTDEKMKKIFSLIEEMLESDWQGTFRDENGNLKCKLVGLGEPCDLNSAYILKAFVSTKQSEIAENIVGLLSSMFNTHYNFTYQYSGFSVDDFYGILFMKDSFYYKSSSKEAAQSLAYTDIKQVEAIMHVYSEYKNPVNTEPEMLNITSKDGKVISVKNGVEINENLASLFEWIKTFIGN